MNNVTPIRPGAAVPIGTPETSGENETVADLINDAYRTLDQALGVLDMMQTLLENQDHTGVEPCEGTYVKTTYALQAMIRHAQETMIRPVKSGN